MIKNWVIILSLGLFILGCENDTLPLGPTSLTLRVIEKDGIFIVQRYDRLFLIGTWTLNANLGARKMLKIIKLNGWKITENLKTKRQ